MDDFYVIRKKLFKRYKKFLPISSYVNTQEGLKMVLKLHKTKLEFIIDSNDDYEKTYKKIDTLIVFKKNMVKTMYCQCGVNYNTYTGYVNCGECNLESCVVCYFRNFKDGKGLIHCYRCYEKTGKKFSNKEIFNKYFESCLSNYLDEMGDEKLSSIKL